MEAPLLSHVLQLAGTVDLVAEFDGVLSIIDHKTSSKPKKKEWITDYFLQATCYSIAIEEMYGIKITQLVVAVVVDDDPTPQVFVEDRRNYYKELYQRIDEFRNKPE
jgi:genome maintenance exonuclease 1